jgi:tetratricopeptide (TPR) repeat protein
MTIYGLGGCGKSALVLEFAYRALAECARDFVLWVPAMSRESFDVAYRDIAARLRLPGLANPNADINQLVKEALSAYSSGRWLIIVDNADNPAVLLELVSGDPKSLQLADYLPHSQNGAVLFTTRSRKAARALTPSCVLELRDMSQDEARELLTQHIAEDILLDDAIAIDQLLSILAYLPLAIVQAAAFINNNEISVSDYLSLFQHPGAEIELFSEHFEDPSRYREMDDRSTIAKTWHISFDQIRKLDPLAAEYLSFIACIDRINIPQSMLPLKGRSTVQRVKALGTLTGYAFIRERQRSQQGVNRERFFDMHRLVHVALSTWLHRHDEWANWAHIVMDRLDELVPWGGHDGQEVWAPYLPHALRVARHDDAVEGIDIASLLDRVGKCQTSLGQYTAAEVSHRQASRLTNELLGPEHPDTLTSMSNLALVLDNQSKFGEAEVINRQTLTRSEKVLGSEHPDTLISMSNLAQVLDSQGRYEEAEDMSRQATAGYEKVLGPEHPDTLTSISNLALVLDSQGKYKEAETINRQILAQRKKLLGPEHLDTLESMSNLAGVLDSQGNYKETETINRQILAQRTKVLGPEHPRTLTSMSNLAGALDRQGKYQEAEAVNRQTLALREKVLGPEHLQTLTSVHCLADLLTHCHCYNESLPLYSRACTGYEAVLGKDHATTRACRQQYASALASLKQG